MLPFEDNLGWERTLVWWLNLREIFAAVPDLGPRFGPTDVPNIDEIFSFYKMVPEPKARILSRQSTQRQNCQKKIQRKQSEWDWRNSQSRRLVKLHAWYRQVTYRCDPVLEARNDGWHAPLKKSGLKTAAALASDGYQHWQIIYGVLCRFDVNSNQVLAESIEVFSNCLFPC